MGAVARATDQGGRSEVGPRADATRASTAWSIPEIRVVKDDQGRLRIDQADPATYGAYAARQFLATAEADPRYRDGMTKRPSAPSIRITYFDSAGEPQEIGVRRAGEVQPGHAGEQDRFQVAASRRVDVLQRTACGRGKLAQRGPPPSSCLAIMRYSAHGIRPRRKRGPSASAASAPPRAACASV